MFLKSVLKLLPLLILGAALTGCVSAPVKKTDQSCLVLIPTFVENTSGQAFARKYYLQLTDGYGEFLVSDYSATYITVVIENPGVRIKGIRSEVDRSRNFEGPDSNSPLDVALPYSPGQLVIADKSVALVMRRIDTTSSTSGGFLIDTPPETTEALTVKFRANKANAAWFDN